MSSYQYDICSFFASNVMYLADWTLSVDRDDSFLNRTTPLRHEGGGI